MSPLIFMPEAFAVLLVLIVCLGIYLFAWMRARHPAHRDAVAELRQLRLQHAWLGDQLQRAIREKWDQAMIDRLADQLNAANAKLERIDPSPLTEAAREAEG
jgi:hypothetical protein